MSSTYSSDLKLELMVTGQNAGTWGDKTNTNLNLIQQAIAGFESVTLSSGGTVALAMTDGALSNARNMVIKFATITAAASTVCTIPDSIEKMYIFDCTAVTNPTNLTIKTASGTGFSPDAQKIYAAYSDGTNLNEVSLDTLGGTVAAAQIASSAVTTAKIADDAVTSDKLADDSVVTAAIADDAVVTASIADDAITQALIADDAVGADQLANTAVSAGSYTLASITVDAQGRLTSASSGTVSAANLVLTAAGQGPFTGTYTLQSSSSKLVAYAMSGGGGGGRGATNSSPAGAPGGAGAFGIFEVTTSHPFSKPFQVGAAGNAPGGNGGSTFVSTLFIVNGGTGGNNMPNNMNHPQGQIPGTPGTAPGALFQIVSPFNNTAPNSTTHQVNTVSNILFETDMPNGGGGGSGGPPPAREGTVGRKGALLVYENAH
tara:strand:- start:3127 stop:4422 length:1296 start_codon:yes stop_codon:yes gene_type:complete